jgi:PAS domain S-box-containing protein
LGLPFYSGETLVGILAISDRPGGYDESLIAYLQPLLATCASILERYKSELQRRDAEVALRESEERYRLLVGSAPVPLFVHARGKILYANEACARLLGAESAEKLIDQAVRTFAHPAYQEAFEGRAQEEAGSASVPVQKLTRLDGKVIDAEVVAIPITYHRAPATQVIIHDVTERIRAERAEREQRILAEALHDTAAVVNSTLELAQVLDLILANVGQVVPHDASSIMLVDEGIARLVGHRGYSERGLAETIETMRLVVSVTPNLRAMSESHGPLIIPDVREYPGWVAVDVNDWVRSYAGVPIMLGGEAIGFINLDSNQPGFFTTLHAERLQTFASQAAIAIQNARLYEAARHHAAQLESSNNELEAYSHTVAHDLKAPLHIVIGYSSLLLSDYNDQLTPEILAHVDQIEIYARKMNDMIENLLLLARLRDAQTALFPVAVLPVVQSAQDRFRQRIDERGVEVTVEPDLPAVMGYGPWLEEVFANLIENAIKYCGPSNPSPRITIRGRTLEDNRVRYEVEDNGLGIAQEHQKHLFEMFTRFHADYTKGAGLGLSIVNRIIRKLGGEVGVVSEPNKGSTFWFTLPAPQLGDPSTERLIR